MDRLHRVSNHLRGSPPCKRNPTTVRQNTNGTSGGEAEAGSAPEIAQIEQLLNALESKVEEEDRQAVLRNVPGPLDRYSIAESLKMLFDASFEGGCLSSLVIGAGM